MAAARKMFMDTIWVLMADYHIGKPNLLTDLNIDSDTAVIVRVTTVKIWVS